MAKEKDGNWFKRHKILTGILVFIALAVVISALGGGTESSTNDNQEPSESAGNDTKPAETNAKLGEAARDGKFEFVVSSVKCGAKTLGTNEFTQAKAQGEFCVMDLTVKNIGDEPQTLLANDQYLFNAEGQKYSYDSDSIIALDDTGDVWLEEINPGNTVKGKMAYDVPVGTKITKAELHDSAFSNGVVVTIN